MRSRGKITTTCAFGSFGSIRLLCGQTIISDLASENPRKPTASLKPTPWLVERIVSGGQTGVDRASLDAAIAIGIVHGGWCPQGRIAEDGPIPVFYQLQEHPSPQYSDRTKRNVIDSDATLILYNFRLEGGTFKTFRYAETIGKPCLKIRLTHPGRIERVREWLVHNHVRTLNIAGPRASKEPEIYQRAYDYLIKLFPKEGEMKP